jgi:hypothetical protein
MDAYARVVLLSVSRPPVQSLFLPPALRVDSDSYSSERIALHSVGSCSWI